MIRAIALSICLSVACGGGAQYQNIPSEPAAPPPKEAAAPKPEPAPPKSLFGRPGREPAIQAVAEEFAGRPPADPRVKEGFFNTDAENLKRLLVELVCQATGG